MMKSHGGGSGFFLTPSSASILLAQEGVLSFDPNVPIAGIIVAHGGGPVRYWSWLLTSQGVTPQQVRFLSPPLEEVMKIYGTILKHPYTGRKLLSTGKQCPCCPGEMKHVGRKKARREAKKIIENWRVSEW